MKLTFFEASALRRFRQGVRIDHFEPGLNVFSGPNGSGKSSIVRAIRAAFFERHQTKTVTDLRPWQEPGAAPQVRVRFEHDDVAYELDKRFLRTPHCVLTRAGQRLENATADEFLADLLGYQLKKSGKNSDDNLGVPGLLWIEQGSGQDISDSTKFAQSQLREALNTDVHQQASDTGLRSGFGAITSAFGDQVLLQLQKLRDEFLTVRHKTPRGQYQQNLTRLAELDAQILETSARVTSFRAMVDELGAVRQQLDSERSGQPWLAMEQQAEHARQALRDTEKVSQQLESLRADAKATLAEQGLLEQRLESLHQQAGQITAREQEVNTATQAHEQAKQSHHLLKRDVDKLTRRYQDARSAHEASQRAELGDRARRQLQESQQALKTLKAAFKDATNLRAQTNKLRQRMARVVLTDDIVSKLSQLERQLQTAQVHLDSAATQIQWSVNPSHQLTQNGEPIGNEGEQAISESTAFEIAGVGTVTIKPGGRDLSQTRQQIDEARTALTRALKEHSVDSVEQAHQLMAQRQGLTHEIALIETRFQQLAPDGFDALEAQVQEQANHVTQLQSQVSKQGNRAERDEQAPELPGFFDVVDIEQSLESARAALSKVREDEARGHSRLSHCEAAMVAARQALEQARASGSDEARDQAMTTLSGSIKANAQRQNAIMAQTEKLQLASKVEDRSQAEQDIQRLSASAQALRQAAQEREQEHSRLLGALSEAGANGSEETLAQLQASRDRLQRLVNDQRRRAQALDLLVERIAAARESATRKLQAPLQQYLDHYLQLLFPQASMALTDSLTPGELFLAGHAGAEAGSFDDQSFGTREQLALISRLAYADLLRAAGKPTLIMIDDGLVHTDQHRMTQMKRILFDAASRHQILVFTCHEERWQDVGVQPRDVRKLLVADTTNPLPVE